VAGRRTLFTVSKVPKTENILLLAWPLTPRAISTAAHKQARFMNSPPLGGGWRFTVLYTLNGEEAFANLSMDASGNFYDTTWFGGGYGFGAVFKLTNSGGRWTYTSLHDFTGGSDGWDPLGNVLIDGSGKLYGTTSGGGFRDCESWGCGVVWEITP
jgi:hypothetical protein